MKTINTLRGTGRTTRMIEKAKRLDAAGLKVYIACANENHAWQIRKMLPPDTNIICRSFTHLKVWPYNGELIGERPGTSAVLADHYAIEQDFAWVLEELHRYDNDEQQ